MWLGDKKVFDSSEKLSAIDSSVALQSYDAPSWHTVRGLIVDENEHLVMVTPAQADPDHSERGRTPFIWFTATGSDELKLVPIYKFKCP